MKLTEDQLHKYNAGRSAEVTSMVCWAPAKSMYLGLRGNVMTCCYNKAYVIGTYPGQSLHDIWFGEKRQKLFKNLKTGDFSMGCQACQELIEAGNYAGLPAKNFDQLPVDKLGFPTKIDFELSNECNLECLMCRGEFSSSIRKNREKLPAIPTPYDAGFVKQLEAFIPHLKTSHFLGGEPFLIPIYQDIWEMIYRINPSVRLSIQTNGTVLSDRVKKILDGLNFDISVSIDSVEKQNYELIRKNGKFETTVSNINYLKDYCKRKGTNFSLSACPMTINWQELPNIVKFANDLNAEVYFTKVYYPKEVSLESLSAEKLDEIESTLTKETYLKETPLQKKNYQTLSQFVGHIGLWKKEAMLRGTLTAKNFIEYMKGLRDYIIKNERIGNPEDLFENVKDKIQFLLVAADQSNNRKNAEAKIVEVNYKTMLEMVPGIEKEHLLHLFRSFVLPLEGRQEN